MFEGMLDAEETLLYLIEILLISMEELKDYKNTKEQQFQYGERVAYTECMEIVQKWKKAAQNGLNFNVEEVYPL